MNRVSDAERTSWHEIIECFLDAHFSARYSTKWEGPNEKAKQIRKFLRIKNTAFCKKNRIKKAMPNCLKPTMSFHWSARRFFNFHRKRVFSLKDPRG